MGLLDATPDDWLEFYRRAVQNRSPNDGSADAAHDPAPSWLPRSLPQRAPLSLARPSDGASNAWPSAPVAPVVLPPQDGQPTGLPSWVQAPTENPFVESPRQRCKWHGAQQRSPNAVPDRLGTVARG
jgi:hypothetical protein